MRTTFTTKEEAEETTATLEAQYENTERSQYVKYDDTRRVLSHLFDHTNGVNPSTTPGYSIRLNGSDNERNGIARSLSVMPGDKIDMQVFGKYYDPNTPQTNQTAWDNLVGLITQVANAAQTVVVDGVGYTSGALRIPPATGVLTDPNENASYPKAHLNWATFDRDWKFLDGGAKQLQGGAEDGTDVPFAEISKSIEIKEPGYVYIWLSNTSASELDVFFDDFKIIHTKSPVVQQEEYYPFGLTFNSYQRESIMKNNYLYNGKELQDELSIGWMDYGARMYDSNLGRWHNPDLLSELKPELTPFRYCFNNPISYTDPLGLWERDAQGNWTTKDASDIARFISYIGAESAMSSDNKGPSIKMMNTFIKDEESSNGKGKLSDGSYLLNEATAKVYVMGGNVNHRHVYIDKASMTNTWHEVQSIFNPDVLDTRTLNQNIFGRSYPGPNNPKTYSGKDDYSFVPNDPIELPGYMHDKEYDRLGIRGADGLMNNEEALGADARFVLSHFIIGIFHPTLAPHERHQSFMLGIGLGALATPKFGNSLLPKKANTNSN